jgi:zona occludens toxin (predicted ATPase)
MPSTDPDPRGVAGRPSPSRRIVFLICIAALLIAMIGLVVFSITQVAGTAGQGGAPGDSATTTAPPAQR